MFWNTRPSEKTVHEFAAGVGGESMIERLREWAKRRGYRLAVGPGSLLSEARAEISGRAERGELDPELVRKWLGWITGALAGDAPAARSVIAVAIPCPAHLVRFTLPDRVLTAHVPPTYAEDARLSESVREQMAELLPALRDDLHPVQQGRKRIAARLGLTAYGLNNITYAQGLGSFIWLGAYATGAVIEPFSPVTTGSPQTLEECADCGICPGRLPDGRHRGGAIPAAGGTLPDILQRAAGRLAGMDAVLRAQLPRGLPDLPGGLPAEQGPARNTGQRCRIRCGGDCRAHR